MSQQKAAFFDLFLKWLVLSDTIVLGLIGSTTINVTAFFLSVTKYLFPNQPGS